MNLLKSVPARRAAIALFVTGAATAAAIILLGPNAYPWVKAVHVMAVISWMAAMLYLPRLFVNHAEQPVGSPQSEMLKGMEWRLARIIMNPAMVLAWVLGLWLVWNGGFLKAPWLHAKLLLVLLLSALHGYYSVAVRRFAEDQNTHSAGFWRVMNEVPALLMIGIVILVVVKPF
jgi:protoporphyrinogen IX oxidase